MILILLYFMFWLLCLMWKVLGAYSEKEKVDTETIGLTCFGIPIIVGVCAWALEGMSVLTDSIIVKCVLGVAECSLVVLAYIGGCFSLEKLIIGMQENKKQAVHRKGIRAEHIICGCILLTGICGGVSTIPEECLYRILQGINEFFGVWMIFLSYWIITIVFVNHIVREKNYMNVLTRWKAQDGPFLMIMKIVIVLYSICTKTLWFMSVAHPIFVTPISVKYDWVDKLDSVLFQVQDKGAKYHLLIVLPILFVLYFAAAIGKRNQKNKKDMTFGATVLIECVVTGFWGFILWLGSWR